MEKQGLDQSSAIRHCIKLAYDEIFSEKQKLGVTA